MLTLMKASANDSIFRAVESFKSMKLKTVPIIAAIAALQAGGWGAGTCSAAEEGVALAIVYDTSGSMRETVRDLGGRMTPKYVIANRALVNVARQIEKFATNSVAAPKKIHTALFVFHADSAREAVPMGPFDRAALEEWANRFSNPAGNTPLGNTLSIASRAVLASPLSKKHVLIITDGINTAGPSPTVVMPRVLEQARQKQAALSIHFVAFDVDARVFDGVKKLGATVVGASDEKQLGSQLEYILQRKILLEDEEPKKP